MKQMGQRGREGGKGVTLFSLNRLLPELSHLVRPEHSTGSHPSSLAGMAAPENLLGPALPGCVSELSPYWMDDLGQVADSNFIRDFLPAPCTGKVLWTLGQEDKV